MTLPLPTHNKQLGAQNNITADEMYDKVKGNKLRYLYLCQTFLSKANVLLENWAFTVMLNPRKSNPRESQSLLETPSPIVVLIQSTFPHLLKTMHFGTIWNTEIEISSARELGQRTHRAKAEQISRNHIAHRNISKFHAVIFSIKNYIIHIHSTSIHSI